MRGWAGAAAAALAATAATAGPPFLTDDPEPVEPRHHEFYVFATYASGQDGTEGAGPGIEYNLGAAADLQIHVVAPIAHASPAGGLSASGPGDLELGAKYRFVHETARRPQVAVFPLLELPTGNADRGSGNGRIWARLPVWVQKSFGAWTTYGGGGWVLNHAPGAKSHAFAGWLLQRDVAERLMLGGELYTEGAEASGGLTSTVANVGGQARLSDTMSLLFSAGRSIGGDRAVLGYLALIWTWGPR